MKRKIQSGLFSYSKILFLWCPSSKFVVRESRDTKARNEKQKSGPNEQHIRKKYNGSTEEEKSFSKVRIMME